MAFSTACSKSVIRRLRLWLLTLAFLPALAWAAEIDIANPQLLAGDDGYVLSADFKFELNPRLEEAVTKGVALYFVADFELTKARWYWLDEKLVSRSQTYRLSYNALTRQYRLSVGSGLHQSFPSLSDALQVLTRLRNWGLSSAEKRASVPVKPMMPRYACGLMSPSCRDLSRSRHSATRTGAWLQTGRPGRPTCRHCRR